MAVLKFGSQRFGLLVDDVLESEEIVVKALHPLLRPLGVYAGATILGDGEVALILSVEGLARHSGVAYRPLQQETAALPGTAVAGEVQTLLLFRSGPAELLAMPLAEVRRVVKLTPEQIETVGEREFVNVDGAAINVLRLDHFLQISAARVDGSLFLILPRDSDRPVGVLATEITDTPTLPVQLDVQAYRADGVLGTAMIRGQIAVLLDLHRLIELWATGTAASQNVLPPPAGQRILVVEDSQFFRQLVAKSFEGAGYAVVAAADGAEGLERLRAADFDLVVSDIEMPGMDGLVMARRIREDERFNRLPLVALTSLAGEADRRRVADAGFDAHEVKLDRRSLLATVQRLLAAGRPGVAGQSLALRPAGEDWRSNP